MTNQVSNDTVNINQLPVDEACKERTAQIRAVMKKLERRLDDMEMDDPSWPLFGSLTKVYSDLKDIRTFLN